ncbi:MAG: hypothetical protein WEB89_01110, partial [Balneolales bacterium]
MINQEENLTVRFTLLILLMDAAILAVAGYPLYVHYGQEILISFITGFIITSVGFITALYLIESKYDEAFNTFMVLVMGGMLGKLFFFSGAILFVFIFSFLNPIGFTIAVLISYIYKSVTEIIFINKISSKSRL